MLEKLKKNKGLYQFVKRSVLFFSIIIGLYLLIFLWVRHLPFFVQYLRIGEGFYLPWLTGLRKTDFLNATAFVAIAFLIWNRESFAKLKPTKRSVKQTVLFGVLSVVFLVSHYVFKYFVGIHAGELLHLTLLIALLKLGFLVLFAVCLAIAIYTVDFIKRFLKTYWKSLLIFIGIGVLYFFLIQVFQLIWYDLSYFVTLVLQWLLGLLFDSVYYSAGTQVQGPRLGAEGFNVAISNECSGVDSLLLFISLYALLLVLDWKKMHVKRMLLLLIPGLIGTVAYNILRIYLLMLVGIYIDPEFAIDIFHTNIGWMLFLLFFIVFWHFGSKWVYQKPKRKSKKT